MSRNGCAISLAALAVALIFPAEKEFLAGDVTAAVIVGGIVAAVALILLAMAASR